MNTKQQWFMANYGRWLPRDKTAQILEIGPGAGEICELLASKLGYANYSGIDISDYYLNASSPGIKDRIIIVRNVVEHLATRPNSIDLVILQHCLEHIPKCDQWPVVAAIRESLRPGGVVIVEVPNIANMFVGPYYRYSDTTHEIGFTDCSLDWTLRRGGFAAAEIAVMPTRVPLVSPLRYVQFALQWVLEHLQKLLIYAFLPNARIATSMYISAIAIKQR